MTTYLDTLSRNYNFLTVQQNLWKKADDDKYFNHLWKETKSKKNIIFAFKRLSLSSGRNIPGPDGLTFKDIKFIDETKLISEVRKRLNGKIKTDGRIIKLPKKNKKGHRFILIKNVFDRIAEYCFLNVLEPILEHNFSIFSYGYRRNKDPLDAIQSVFYSIQSVQDGELWKVDLSNFFDSIKFKYVKKFLEKNHKIKDQIFLNRLENILKNKNKEIYLTEGSILGPILSNVFLDDLERIINDKNGINRAIKSKAKMPLRYIRKQSREVIRTKGIDYYKNKFRRDRISARIIRYADDFIVVSNNSVDLPIAINIVKNWCKKYEVTINESKCKYFKIKKDTYINLDFLGYNMTRKLKPNQRGLWTFGPSNSSLIWKECRKKLRKIMFSPKADRKAMSIILGYFEYFQLTTNMSWFINRLDRLFYNWSKKTRKNQHKKHPNNFWKEEGHVIYHWNNTKFDLYELRERTRVSWLSRNKQRKKEMVWNPCVQGNGSYNRLVDNILEFNYHPEDEMSFKVFIPGLIYKQKIEPVTKKSLSEFSPQELIVHHIKPRKLGGSNDFCNLVIICEDTHKMIHYWNPDREKKFRKRFPNYSKEKLNAFRQKADKDYWND